MKKLIIAAALAVCTFCARSVGAQTTQVDRTEKLYRMIRQHGTVNWDSRERTMLLQHEYSTVVFVRNNYTFEAYGFPNEAHGVKVYTPFGFFLYKDGGLIPKCRVASDHTAAVSAYIEKMLRI